MTQPQNIQDIQTEVGALAGSIWRYLEKTQDATDLELKAALNVSSGKFLLLAAGWLLRENKLNLIRENGGFRLSIRK